MDTILHIVEATQTGVGRHVFDLLKHSEQHRFTPSLCFSLNRSDPYFRTMLKKMEKKGGSLYEVPMYQIERPLANVRAVSRIRSPICHKHIAIIHAHSAIGGMIGRFAAHRERVPVTIYTPNGWPFLSTSDRLLAGLYRRLERMAERWCDKIICVSEHERRLGLRYRIAPPEKFEVIHNGIDIEKIRGDRAQARQNLGLPADAIVIGTVTRFAYQKDPLGLLQALEPILLKDRQRKLVMVGEGPLLPRAKTKAEKLGIAPQVIFTGFRTDAVALLFAFDLFVLPSRYEGLSYAMLEAMAAGLPVVTTVGGGEDAITNGVNGYVVPVSDPAALHSAVERLMVNSQLRHHMSEQNRKIILRFSVQQQVRRTQALYDRLLQQQRV